MILGNGCWFIGVDAGMVIGIGYLINWNLSPVIPVVVAEFALQMLSKLKYYI